MSYRSVFPQVGMPRIRSGETPYADVITAPRVIFWLEYPPFGSCRITIPGLWSGLGFIEITVKFGCSWARTYHDLGMITAPTAKIRTSVLPRFIGSLSWAT